MSTFGIIFIVLIVISIISVVRIVRRASKGNRPTVNPQGSPTQSTPATGDTNHPPAGHATSDQKKKSSGSKIAQIMGIIILFVITIVLVVWGFNFVVKTFKSIFKSSPQYRIVLVEVRTVRVNLDSEFNEANTVKLNKDYGEVCTFKNATVSFCVKNTANEMVCGDPYTDPNLPAGEHNSKLWFKSKDGPYGTIDVVISQRQRKLIN